MENEVATVAKSEVAVSANDRLLEKVLDSGNIEVLERFIALREKEENRQARLAFDLHFSEMQKEFTPAKRSKKAYDSWYAPVEELQKQFNPIITAHGFSYSWKEEAQPESVKRIYIMISGWGYTKEAYFDCPILPGTKQMNPVQIEGARTTYGKRYTFLSGFGITTEDEDTDAMTFDDGVRYADIVLSIENTNTADELKAAWKAAWESLANDQAGKDKMTVIYNKKKAEIIGQKK